MIEGYQSDITRKQFELVRYILESARKITSPRKYDLYDIFCAILYIVKEGCTWRGLPHDFPKWNMVYYYFQMWGKVDETGVSLFEQVMRELVISERVIKGREAKTSMIIVDSKSIKNTDLAEEKGYDAGKNFWDKSTYWCGYKWSSACNTCYNRKYN
jgi:transposase